MGPTCSALLAQQNVYTQKVEIYVCRYVELNIDLDVCLIQVDQCQAQGQHTEHGQHHVLPEGIQSTF